MDEDITSDQYILESKTAIATTLSGDQTTEKQGDYTLTALRPAPVYITSRAPYPQYGSYGNSFNPFQSGLPLSNSTSSTMLPPPGLPQPEMSQTNPAGMDTTGQKPPQSLKLRGATNIWKGGLCFGVEAKGIRVARRRDNSMINGTKLLNVAGIVKDIRDGILESEKIKHIVKDGPEHLRGVWIPFEKALDFANKERITEVLFPLFLHSLSALLYHPTNQPSTVQIGATAGRPREQQTDSVSQVSHSEPSMTTSMQNPLLEHHNDKASSYLQQPAFTPQNDQPPLNLFGLPLSPTPSSSTMGGWESEGEEETETLDSRREECKKTQPSRLNDTSQSGTMGMSYNDDVPKALPQLIIVSDQSSAKSSLLESLSNVPFPKDQQICTRHATQITSRCTTGGEYVEAGESNDVDIQIGSLSPSQKSPQSDSEHSSDSEAGLLTRNERRGILLQRLMAYFFELWSSCPSPAPLTITESPMTPNARNLRQTTEASFSGNNDCHQYMDQENGQVQDGLDSGAGQYNVSSSTAASGNRHDHALHQSTGPIQKRDRDKEDDEKDERQPGKRARIDNDKNNAPKRLACPYFKNDPEHPRLGRSCSGPGWGTAHRLKEHLDRNHALPPSCVRCYTAFDTEADRDTHMRIQDRCQVRERLGRMHGFDAAQKEQLRSRPKGYKHMSETQKWCHIYMILFPETASTEVPSPYYEFVSFRDSGHPVDPMTEYENFLRHEMPDRVRHQLELRIEEALNPLEETLRGQIVDIVRDVQLELFQSFRASAGPTRPNGDSVRESASIEIDDNPDKSRDEEREDTDAQDSTVVARNTEPPGQFDSGQCSWEEQLEAYRQVPPLDFSFTDFDDFDGALFDFSSVIPAAQDSAYGTLSISQEETDKDEFIGNGTGI